MTDKVTTEKRSEIMRAIKSKGSKMEQDVRDELDNRNIKYEVNVKEMEGKPDIVLEDNKVVIFLDSCFWHGCKYHCRMPHTNENYWRQKIAKNIERDNRINKVYEDKGWKVIRFWEHEIKESIDMVISNIEKQLNK